LSDLSLEKDEDGKALSCSTLTDVPIARQWNKGVQQGKATRKLSQFMFVRHVSLHFVPGPTALPFEEVSRFNISPPVWIQGVDGEAVNVVQNLFPRVRGIALGRGFMPSLVAKISEDHPMPCEDPAHHVPNPEWIDRFDYFPNVYKGIQKFVLLFSPAFSIPLYCWNLDDIPSGLCEEAKRQLVHILIDDKTWQYSYVLQTHSTFPQTKLDPWTRVRRHWRHYITVDASQQENSRQEEGDGEGKGRKGDDGGTNEEVHKDQKKNSDDPAGDTDPIGDDTGDDADDEDEDGTDDDQDSSSKLLQDLAEDVYTIAAETLESIAYSEKPRRRDMVYTGLSEHQVRRIEQKFVEVVRREFADPDDVIIDPSLHDSEDSEDDDSQYDYYDRNHNRYGDGGSDPEDDDAVRDHQKRVEMFDFFHGARTTKCEVCGAGQGRDGSRYRDSPEREGF